MLSFSRLGQVGRLGNQLFQLAFITYFAEKHGIDYELPAWKYATYFDYPFNFKEQLDDDYQLIIKEPSLYYQEDLFVGYLPTIRSARVNIITGYFQSCKYFSKNHALKIFKPGKKFKPIQIDPSKSIAISVRRGDFVKHRLYNNIEAKSFRDILKGLGNLKVFVFSDDFNYCRNEFIGDQYEFMEGLSDIEQLITFSQFEVFILSNSTFSYWGPMLSKNVRKVFYPYYMFPDLDRCKQYNNDYWPANRAIYEPYFNPINKPFTA